MARYGPLDDSWSGALRANWSDAGRQNRHYASPAQENKHKKHKHEDDEAHFRRCWSRQDCRGCLDQTACSWCPFTATCVPNDYSVPALAPAFDDMVCPYWAERWELRTRPLGCQVSTITSLTALVAGSGTLAVAFLIWLFIRSVRRGRLRWKARQQRQQELLQQAQQSQGQQEDALRWRPVMWFRQTIAEDARSVSEPAMSPNVQPSEPRPPTETLPVDERTPLLAT